MPKLTLPAALAGMPRPIVALVVAGLLAVGGGIATLAVTAGLPDASPPMDGPSTVSSASAEPAPSTTGVPSGAPASPSASDEAVSISENALGAGGNNVVMINNHQDDSLRVKGSVQLNRINAPNVAPQNLARAYSSCTDCETLAVAMQVNLIRRDTNRVVPANAAVAINYQCTRCRTIAVALQYTLSVDDPMQTPHDVRQLVRQMDLELREIARAADSLSEAIERINGVIGRFVALADSLDDQRDEAADSTTPGATDESDPPSPSATPSATPVASAEPTPTPEAEATLTPTPRPSEGTPSPSPSP